ncbi:subtilisin-like protein [Rhizodiscina lignyota]|uniref:tripeptidyl-peptidase II n=1 Tax=Rhizodiscina lignyota TaxID=1504668 RepID=A0A9P4IM31_9PEZI|nr:subtilisin-like protein [Rhizodiscina lignyota]
MFFLVFLSWLAASHLVIASALSSRSSYLLKEKHIVPTGWRRIGPAPAHRKVSLQISLRQDRFEELERHLYEVSDPSHVRYGQHLSQWDVTRLIKPSTETLDLVHAWLADHGYGAERLTYSAAKDRLKITLPISAVEKMLQTKYSIYRHEDGTQIMRAPEWSLPACLHEHIPTIQPTTSFFRARPQKRTVKTAPMTEAAKAALLAAPKVDLATASVADVCNVSAIVPDCLRTLYKTSNYTVQAADKNMIGIANYLGEYNNRSDIGLFLNQFRSDTTARYSLNVTLINGAIDHSTFPDTPTEKANGTGLEGNLDAEYVFGIAYPTKVQAYNTGGRAPVIMDLGTPTDTNEPYMNWLDYMLDLENPPQTITTSYGDDEQSVPMSYAITVCNQLAQLGARGVSLLFASGDTGVGMNGTCFSNDGRNTSMFLPNFPASCPYVTIVGATQQFAPEIVAFDQGNGFVSGGGFSNYFPRPSYQDAVVSSYTKSLNGQFQGQFNSSGRAYPDVAAQGQSFVVIWEGVPTLLDGTSAATPTFAAVIALVNDMLISQGKPPMGFLNPWLYQRGFEAMNDVTNGSAIGCNTAGFPAREGWDAVTGFGTPVCF